MRPMMKHMFEYVEIYGVAIISTGRVDSLHQEHFVCFFFDIPSDVEVDIVDIVHMGTDLFCFDSIRITSGTVSYGVNECLNPSDYDSVSGSACGVMTICGHNSVVNRVYDPCPLQFTGSDPYPPCPTPMPTLLPTNPPSSHPTKIPTKNPTRNPTVIPTNIPTQKPSPSPTKIPTINPTQNPSLIPSTNPSSSATKIPTINPTQNSSLSPIKIPTENINPSLNTITNPTEYAAFITSSNQTAPSRSQHIPSSEQMSPLLIAILILGVGSCSCACAAITVYCVCMKQKVDKRYIAEQNEQAVAVEKPQLHNTQNEVPMVIQKGEDDKENGAIERLYIYNVKAATTSTSDGGNHVQSMINGLIKVSRDLERNGANAKVLDEIEGKGEDNVEMGYTH
eukprot:740943_1